MAHNIDAATLDLKETVVVTRRVSKTVKGGRIMRFAAPKVPASSPAVRFVPSSIWQVSAIFVQSL